MRIMLDTNVLVSLLLFPNPQMNEMIENIFADHQLVLSSFVVDELKEVVKRKFPSKIKVVEVFFEKSYQIQDCFPYRRQPAKNALSGNDGHNQQMDWAP